LLAKTWPKYDVGKTMPQTSHDWEWFIYTTYKSGDLGDGLLLFYHVLPTLVDLPPNMGVFT